jgi:hypothetical protein
MSLSDTSIEERSIISSLAATRSFSAVVFLAPASLVGTLVFNCDPIALPAGKSAPQISRCCGPSQELID